MFLPNLPVAVISVTLITRFNFKELELMTRGAIITMKIRLSALEQLHTSWGGGGDTRKSILTTIGPQT